MISPSWEILVLAVSAIRKAAGVSGGAACTLLCEACESGVVRSRKQPWSDHPDEPPDPIYDQWTPPISKVDWRGASIDLEYGWLILASGEILRGTVWINVDDLNHWLKAQQAAPSKQKAVGKRPRIKKLLTEKFPNGVPEPGDYPRKDLRAELLERDPSLRPLDEATLKQAIDEFNDNR